MSGRLIIGVLIDFVSWHTAMLIIGALALIAATVFWKILPESRNFRASSLKPRSLVDGFVMHFKDAGLPWLFLEAFLLMGAFVTMFNYIGYRLLADPSTSPSWAASLVYLRASTARQKSAPWPTASPPPRALGDLMLMLAGMTLTLFTTRWLIVTGI